ncbi:cytidylyltransferase domain-containing protein [Hydrogenimonas sp.]
MQNLAVVIPAQEKNPYHEKGDLAPFGDMTLLEWKISQCKEFVSNDHIYVTTPSATAASIAEREGVRVVHRPDNLSYEEMLVYTMDKIVEDIILWAIPTAPFVSPKLYREMVETYRSLPEDYDSLIPVRKMQEYFYFKGEKLNFGDTFVSRRNVEPLYMVTNGCYISLKQHIANHKVLFGSKEYLYEVDELAAMEIKDIKDFTFANNLISYYFKQLLAD